MNESNKAALSPKDQITHYKEHKESLLQQYKNHATALEYALDDCEAGLIKEKREMLAKEIKLFVLKISELEQALTKA